MFKSITYFKNQNINPTPLLPLSNINTESIIDQTMSVGYSKLRNGDINKYSQINLNNNLLITYIHNIYSKYDIPDPMNQSKGKQNQILKTMETSVIKNSNLKDSSNKIIKLKQSFKNQLQRTAVQSQSGQSRINKVTEDSSCFAFTYQQPVVHYYRYCIVCQSMIETSNIIRHEKNCEGFDLIYNMNTVELIEYLKTKIQRLQGEISQNLKQKQQINELIVKQFLKSIKQEKLNDKLENNYNKLINNLPKGSLNILQLSYKIKWFRKVLQQIKCKFL